MKIKKASAALMSVLILAAFSLVILSSMVQISISEGYKQINQSNNQLLYYAADACLNEGILRLELDNSYIGSSITIDASTTCTNTVTENSPTSFTLDINSATGNFTHDFTAELTLATGTHRNTITLDSYSIQ
jgi:hypothetical protein